MPPKTQFSKQDIVEAAFQIAAEEGFDAITARKVAGRLGSSVAPIYHNFEHIEALKRAVVDRVVEIGRAMMKQRYTGDPFLDVGVVSLKFAREYSTLFRDLVLRPNPYVAQFQQGIGDDVLGHMRQDGHLAELSDEELQEVLLKLRIFQGGLSMMVANGLLPESFDEAAQIELLSSAGEDVIAGVLRRRSESKK